MTENTNHTLSKRAMPLKKKTKSQPSAQVLTPLPHHVLFIFIYCFCLAVLFLLIASKSSPLYTLNDWQDANTFFTMGKGMMNGRVLYRDLFDQKGPLLYFLFGLGYLISNTTFLGVFIIEVIALALFLYFSYKIIALFVDYRYTLITLPLIVTAVLNLRSFGHGGSAEQLLLPFLAASLYDLLRFFKQRFPEPMPKRSLLINGIIAGCVLWIKYPLLGFWLGWATIVLLGMIINKHYRHAVEGALVFLAGMLAATLPWMAYFGVSGAIGEWIHSYIIINLTTYAQSYPLREILWITLNSYRHHRNSNPLAISLLIFGILVFVSNKKYIQSWLNRLGLLLCLGLLAVGVYAGGRDYVYYFFIFSPFILFGFICLISLYAETYDPIKSSVLMILIIGLSAGSWAYTYRYQRNTYMLEWEQEDFVQYKFADIINHKEGTTLLNYGFQDGGFYIASGITPNVRFFQDYNIAYGRFPLPKDEQNRYINEGLVDFVVFRTQTSEESENPAFLMLNENYDLVTSEQQAFGDQVYVYWLFEKRP